MIFGLNFGSLKRTDKIDNSAIFCFPSLHPVVGFFDGQPSFELYGQFFLRINDAGVVIHPTGRNLMSDS